MAETSKVHFDAGQVQQTHNSEIAISYLDNDKIEVHLGFLQIFHTYEITFIIKDSLSEDLQSDPLQNLNVRVNHVRPTEDGEGHVVQVQLYAHKEKLWREQLVVTEAGRAEAGREETARAITIVFKARVLGKGKGKPSLLNGIHCTGVNVDEDSEQSDWQGFD